MGSFTRDEIEQAFGVYQDAAAESGRTEHLTQRGARRHPATEGLGHLLEPGPLIGVHPGSGSPYKNWALNRWRDVLLRLHEANPRRRFLVSTGEAEEEAVSEFLKSLTELQLPVIPANRLPLPVLGAALSQCQLYLGHDSGISHLAGAVGTPSIVLFGPTEEAVWAPPHRHVNVLKHPSRLLNEITVHQVADEAERRLA